VILLAEHDEPTTLAAKKKRQPGASSGATSTPKNRVWGFENTASGRPVVEPYLSRETAIGSVQFTYENASGRAEWLSRDPLKSSEIHQGPNVYEYVQNIPTYYTDPYGLWAGGGAGGGENIHFITIGFEHSLTIYATTCGWCVQLQQCVDLGPSLLASFGGGGSISGGSGSPEGTSESVGLGGGMGFDVGGTAGFDIDVKGASASAGGGHVGPTWGLGIWIRLCSNITGCGKTVPEAFAKLGEEIKKASAQDPK
jgi:hypothetical protein